MGKYRRLWDTYRFPGFSPRSTLRGIFGDTKARILGLRRRGKKRFAVPAGISSEGGTIANGVGCGIWRAGGLSNLLGYRGAPNRLPAVYEGEAREAGVACGQSVLQQAIRLLFGTALPGRDDQKRCSRNAPGLEDSQGVGQAVHAGAATQDRHSNSQGHWG